MKSTDDVGRYVDDVLRGKKSADDFKLGDGATPVARAALEDREPLKRFQQVVDEAPNAACHVAGLVSDAADPSAGFFTPMRLDSEDVSGIKLEALGNGIPQRHTDRVVDAAREMAQSTWVDAADTACDVAEQL